MSRRYWLPLIAVVGLTLAANAQGVGNQTADKPSTSKNAAQPKPNPPPSIPVAVQGDIERIARALEAANAKPEPADQASREERDVRAQEYMASWVPKMFWLGGIEIVLTMIGIGLVWQTFQQTRRAAKAAEDAVTTTQSIGEAGVRAYLHIKSVSVAFWKGFDKPIFDVVVTNTGQSPGHRLVCGAQVRYEWGVDCPAGPLPTGWRNELGKAVPVGGEESLNVQCGQIPLTAEDAATSLKEEFGALMHVHIAFAYRDVFDKIWDSDAYFVGFVHKKKSTEQMTGLLDSPWKAELRPVTRPQDWAVADKADGEQPASNS
jgi:hypothetical protein